MNKFRVWDKATKTMHICGEDIHDSITFDKDNIARYYNLQNGEGSGPQGDYILMRYTGRKTFEDVEIYEGDVLYFSDYDHNGRDTQHIGVVKWIDEISAFIIAYSIDSEEGFWLYQVLANDDEVEIKGNIHANPELLEAVA